MDGATIVARQLDAYNAKDIAAFMACWSEDADYFAFPSSLLAKGKAAIRARHVERFQEPDLHGKLLHRIAVGDMVVDHETVTRNFPHGIGTIEVVAIYQVEAGHIARAWFKQGPPAL